MNTYQIQQVYAFNNARRENLLNEAQKQNSLLEKIKYVVDYFINNLDENEILEIDNTKQFTPFKYDYSFLDDLSEPFGRQQNIVYYENGYFAKTLPQADNDPRDRNVKIYPTIFALKLATCKMFANEIKRFALDFGIKCDIIKKSSYCYDYFNGKNVNYKPVNTNRIVRMVHYYNIIEIDSEKYRIDIPSLLTALDYMENNPDAPKIDISDFYFSKNLEKDSFSKAYSYFKSKTKS